MMVKDRQLVMIRNMIIRHSVIWEGRSTARHGILWWAWLPALVLYLTFPCRKPCRGRARQSTGPLLTAVFTTFFHSFLPFLFVVSIFCLSSYISTVSCLINRSISFSLSLSFLSSLFLSFLFSFFLSLSPSLFLLCFNMLPLCLLQQD